MKMCDNDDTTTYEMLRKQALSGEASAEDLYYYVQRVEEDLRRLRDSGDQLEIPEAENISGAHALLTETREMLAERRDPLAQIDWAKMHYHIKAEYDLSEDIMYALGDHTHALQRAEGWLDTNPYKKADERGGEADQMMTDIETAFMETATDGGEDLNEVIPDETLLGIAGCEWRNPPRIIDSNGTKYAVGWETNGWFTIVHIEIIHTEDGWFVDTVGKFPAMGFHTDNIDQLLAAINER